jgi:sortase A
MPRRGHHARGAIRLIDEDERRTIVLQLAPARPPAHRRSRGGLRVRRGVSALALALIAAGMLALADGVVTLVWQEPISAVYAKLRQDDLRSRLAREERTAATARERQVLGTLPSARQRLAFLASELERKTPDGDAIGRIVIPRIGASFVIVKGTSTSDLESGPGVYPETTFPGLPGTTAIAGHRTTFLAPFRHIDTLRPGNRILLRMPYARFTYAVTGSRVVAPTDLRAAVGEVGYSRLVLSACTPLFSAAKRLLVFARLARVEPAAVLRSITTSARIRRA